MLLPAVKEADLLAVPIPSMLYTDLDERLITPCIFPLMWPSSWLQFAMSMLWKFWAIQ